MLLRVKRVENGYSQRELAGLMSVSQQTIAKWELGITAPSEFSQIRKLERILGAFGPDLFPDIFGGETLAE